MKRSILLIAALLALAACAQLAKDPAPPPVTQPTKIVCLPQVDYSQADQAAFADEVEALDPKKNPQVIRFLGDYRAMRSANRACHNPQ